MNEAIMAISYIVADSERNKAAIVDEEGLGFEDLHTATKKATPQAAQILAGIYLELSFTPEIRTLMACDSNTAASLLYLR